MIEHLQAYPTYKRTGLPWVSEVPEHWSLIPNRALVRRRKILVGERHTDFPLLSLTKQGVIVRDVTTGKGKFSADMGTSQEVRPGDLVFCLFDVPETPRTVGLSRHAGMITGAYTVFEPTGKYSAEFFEQFYIAMDDRKLLSPLYSGLRNTIPPSQFLGTKTPVPSPDEQAAIVRFLDHFDRRIRRYIRAKRRLIAILDEQKQAIIHRAVTRERESEWHSLPVCAILRPVKRVGFPDKTLLSLFRDYGVVPKDSRENKNVDVRDLALCQLVEAGDVVMNKMKAWQGSIAVSPIEGIVSPDYMVLQFVNDEAVPKFFHYLLRSPEMVTEYRRNAYGVRPGQWRLMYPDFRRLRLVAPAAEEQAAIVRLIDGALADIDIAVMGLRREVDLLREFRTRLIADVVTGKLDVREAASRLPEEPEEPEVADDLPLDDNETIDDAEPDLEPEEVEA